MKIYHFSADLLNIEQYRNNNIANCLPNRSHISAVDRQIKIALIQIQGHIFDPFHWISHGSKPCDPQVDPHPCYGVVFDKALSHRHRCSPIAKKTCNFSNLGREFGWWCTRYRVAHVVRSCGNCQNSLIKQ